MDVWRVRQVDFEHVPLCRRRGGSRVYIKDRTLRVGEPPKLADRKRLHHRMTVQIIFVIEHEVAVFTFGLIVLSETRMVGASVATIELHKPREYRVRKTEAYQDR